MLHTSRRNHARRQAGVVLATLIMSIAAGCVFDTSGIPFVCDRYECTVGIYECDVWHEALGLDLRPHPTRQVAQLGSTKAVRNGGLQVGRFAYSDPTGQWAVKKIELPKLRGAAWIQVESTRNVDGVGQLGVQFRPLNPVEGVYVAYDARAQKRPDWLKPPEYVLESIPDNLPGQMLGAPNAHLVIAKPDPLWGQKEVKLEIWRRTAVPAVGEAVVIPANQAGAPAWPAGLPLNETAMYVVIVKPKEQFDCSQVTAADRRDEAKYDNCGDDNVCGEIEARAAAVKSAQGKYGSVYPPGRFSYVVEKAMPLQVCPDTRSTFQQLGVQIRPNTFLRSSEIEFDPVAYKSQAKIEVKGNVVTTAVSGTLHFEYLTNDVGQLLEMQINGMTLETPAISTDVGTYTDVVFSLLEPTSAACTDVSPPYAWPCDQYEIAAGDFAASLAADDGDGTLLVIGKNSGPLIVNIDHTTRAFRMIGGPIRTTLNIDGVPEPLDISIDLTGHFLNFAPVASGEESQKGGPCEERTNQQEIFLDASASFEIYNDALPSNPASYLWFEDYSLPTEKLWGTGKQLIIGKYQLSYGVHEITLLLTDAHGVTDADTFEIEVFDDDPPAILAPQDVQAFLAPQTQTPVKLDIGTAGASDGCSDAVMVFNDAPADSMFPAGTTIVTWFADDGRGNVSTATQKVEVLVLANSIMADPADAVPAKPTSPCGSGIAMASAIGLLGLALVRFTSGSSRIRS